MASLLSTILFTNVGADLYGADYVLLCLVKSLDRRKFRSIVLVPYDGLLVGELEAVGVTMGMPSVLASVFKARQTSWPVIPGSIRSSTIMSGLIFRACSSP